MHNIGTVPTFKMHNVGTVPMFKMHNVGTPKIYDLYFELEFGLYGKQGNTTCFNPSLRPVSSSLSIAQIRLHVFYFYDCSANEVFE